MRATVTLLSAMLCVGWVPSALACWIAPPPIEWKVSQEGDFEVELHNRVGRVVIHPRHDCSKRKWSARLTGFHSIHSRVFLVRKGTRVIHLRANHQVNKLSDVAVEVIDMTKGRSYFRARRFVRRLKRRKPGDVIISADPRRWWLHRINLVSARYLEFTTALGHHVLVDLDSGRIKRAVQPSLRKVAEQSPTCGT